MLRICVNSRNRYISKTETVTAGSTSQFIAQPAAFNPRISSGIILVFEQAHQHGILPAAGNEKVFAQNTLTLESKLFGKSKRGTVVCDDVKPQTMQTGFFKGI